MTQPTNKQVFLSEQLNQASLSPERWPVVYYVPRVGGGFQKSVVYQTLTPQKNYIRKLYPPPPTWQLPFLKCSALTFAQ